MSLRQFKVYTGHGRESLRLVKSGGLSTSTLLSNVDRYSNLTIGVSLVNSAGLESDVEQTLFVGSKHQPTVTEALLPDTPHHSTRLHDSF